MNVQDVINMALNGQDGRAVEPVEHRTCADEQIAKLASALNFIGANLEDSVLTPGEILAQAEIIKEAARGKKRKRPKGTYNTTSTRNLRSNSPSATGLHGMPPAEAGAAELVPSGSVNSVPVTEGRGPVSLDSYYAKMDERARIANNAQRQGSTEFELVTEGREPVRANPKGRVAREGVRALVPLGGTANPDVQVGPDGPVRTPPPSPADEIPPKTVPQGGWSQGGRGTIPDEPEGPAFSRRAPGSAPPNAGHTTRNRGLLLGEAPSNMRRNLLIGGGLAATGALGAYMYNRRNKQQQQKSASVDDVLAYAAHVGKQALLEKVAEDRINPAKISAGPAAPYSGEVMPACSPVFGGQTTPQQLVAMKAQKVRARINSDMKQYVSNVGDGYNLQGHLNKFNK